MVTDLTLAVCYLTLCWVCIELLFGGYSLQLVVLILIDFVGLRCSCLLLELVFKFAFCCLLLLYLDYLNGEFGFV